MKKYLIYGLLLVVLILGIKFRFGGIIAGFSAFTYDHARDLLIVRDMVLSHKPTLLGPTTGLPGVFYGPWWYWFLTIPYILFGGDPRGAVGMVSFLGIVCIILAFLIGKSLGNKFWGFWLASIVSFSPVFISFSSQMWNPYLVPPLMFFSSLILLKIFEEPKKWLFFLLGLIVALTVQLEASFGIFFMLGTLICLIFYYKRKTFLFLLGSLIIFLPQLFFDLRHDFLISKGVMNFISHPKVLQVSLNFWERIINRTEMFFSSFARSFTMENTFLALLILGLSCIGFYFLFKSNNKKKKKFTSFLLIILLVIFIGFSYYRDTVWDYYLIGIPPIFLILLFLSISSLKSKALKTLGVILSIFLVTINLWNNIKPHSDWVGDASVLKNQMEVIDYIYKDANKAKFNVIVYTPPLYDYPYQYLFSWYGQKKYNYVPSTSSSPQKLLYLILEPDQYHPERMIDWLKKRVGDGNPVHLEEFKSGLEVEKRTR